MLDVGDGLGRARHLFDQPGGPLRRDLGLGGSLLGHGLSLGPGTVGPLAPDAPGGASNAPEAASPP